MTAAERAQVLANRWSINITCPRCGHRGDVEETFPCGHEDLVKACEGMLAILEAAAERSGGWKGAFADSVRAALALAAKP